MLLTSGLHPERTAEDYETEPGAFGLHDIATDRSYYSEAKGLKNRAWLGDKDNWLVTTDLRCNVELLNVITGAHV